MCGSGKTEIILASIRYVIKKGGTVGFVCPRRDVIIEIYSRLKNIFVNNKITLIYGGHTSKLEGDLICLTAHQLFRFNHYFDLIIMDEIDAFPYKGNDVLESMFFRAIRGNFILLSATPDEHFVKKFKNNGGEVLELYKRFHKHPLPVPQIIKGTKLTLLKKLINYVREFIAYQQPIFIFTPTIEICEKIFNLLKIFIKNGNYVHSKRDNRSQIIDDFRNEKYKYLVTTAVLERGVTVKDLQVIIYNADHAIYDRYSLVQISGRVGRKKDAPEGKVIYLARTVTIEMEESIKDIEKSNKSLQNLL